MNWGEEWKYDPGHVVIVLLILGLMAAAGLIVAGYLLHVGWSLFGA